MRLRAEVRYGTSKSDSCWNSTDAGCGFEGVVEALSLR